MRNPCKHRDTVVLNPGPFTDEWEWCRVCGATRLNPNCTGSRKEKNPYLYHWSAPAVATGNRHTPRRWSE